MRVVRRLACGDLSRYGYLRFHPGAFSRIAVQGVTVAVDDGFVRALKAGQVNMKPGIDRFEGQTVYFADGLHPRRP